MYLTIVVPTTRKTEELMKSICNQQYLDTDSLQVSFVKEPGLVNARNYGWRNAKNTDIVAFIDDDVILSPYWAEEIKRYFEYPLVGCVMGEVITETGNRDNNWSHPILKKFFKKIGSVQACNMAFRKSVLEEMGGFDAIYSKGVGEWSEPDLVNKVKKAGYKVAYNHNALLWHYPSPQGIYQERAKHSYWRMRNFLTFRKRWLKWDLNVVQVVIIFYCYWIYKFLRTGDINWLGGLCALRGNE